MFREVVIGPCKLYCGDCMDVLPRDVSRINVVTDPPYGIGLRNGDVDGHRSQRPFDVIGDESMESGQLLLEWAEALGIPVIVFSSPWKPWNGKWRNLIAWDKGGAVGGGGDIATCLKRSWELIATARTGPLLTGRMESVWRFAMTPVDTTEHICAKPVPLMRRLIETFVPANSIVFDPFMGSGSTIVAAIESGRESIGVEIDSRNFEVSRRRCEIAWDLKCSELPFEKPEPAKQLAMFGDDEPHN